MPGLGFDFPHLAAISGGARATILLSYFGHNGRRGQGTFVPILFGGYPYYYDDSATIRRSSKPVQQSQPQPQIIVIQQPVPAQQGADSGRRRRQFSASVSGASSGRASPRCWRFHSCSAGWAHSVRVCLLGRRRAIAVRHAGRDSPHAGFVRPRCRRHPANERSPRNDGADSQLACRISNLKINFSRVEAAEAFGSTGFSLWGFALARTKTHRLKPALPNQDYFEVCTGCGMM